MKNFKSYKKQRKGLVTILSVVVLGGFMLTLMAIAYQASIRSLEAQKKVQLQIDYDAREQAFLRSVVTLTPAYAANTMTRASANLNQDQASFAGMFEAASEMARMETARDGLTQAALNWVFGGNLRNGNTGNVSNPGTYSILNSIGGRNGVAAGAVTSAVGAAATPGYGLPLFLRGGAVADAVANSSLYPLVSSDFGYDIAADPRKDFFRLNYPNIHFGYKNPGEHFVARHHWWSIDLRTQERDAAATGLAQRTLAGSEYILSLYEIPSQLAIDSAAVNTEFGGAGTTWDAGIDVQGSVYARGATVNTDLASMATTDGATIDGGSLSAAAAVDAVAYEAGNANFHPISKASDYSRSLFLPINPGIEFFDRFATVNVALPALEARVNQDDWNGYSRGCHQCAMQLTVNEATGTQPLSIILSTKSTNYSYQFYEPGLGAPITFDPRSNRDPSYNGGVPKAIVHIPFHTVSFIGTSTVDTSNGGTRTALRLDIGAMMEWLDVTRVDPVDYDEDHSIVVNVDWTAASVKEPDFPSVNADLAVLLEGVKDLSAFTSGFSFVTNLRMYLYSDLNQVEYETGGHPAVSIYAAEQRIGGQGDERHVTLNGSIGSLHKSGSGIDIAAIRSDADVATIGQLTATLDSVDSVDELPPVNRMNWLVVIQKRQ